jgi:hypothetical protein
MSSRRYFMKRFGYIAAGLLIVCAAFVMLSCSGNSNATKVYGYMDKMLTILEQNKADPQKAGTEIDAYYKSVQPDMEKSLASLKDNPLGIAELAMKIAPLLEKRQKLLQDNEALRNNPSIGGTGAIFDSLTQFGGADGK